jgi:hypothetical protein
MASGRQMNSAAFFAWLQPEARERSCGYLSLAIFPATTATCADDRCDASDAPNGSAASHKAAPLPKQESQLQPSMMISDSEGFGLITLLIGIGVD